jgi:para-nitrobenzyl esterase
MRNTTNPFLLVCVSLCFLAVTVFSQTSNLYKVQGSAKLKDGITMKYRLFVPPSYDPAKKYPLVLILHGGGEIGTDNSKQVSSSSMSLAFISDEVQKKWSPFVLAPQSPDVMHQFARNGVAGPAGDGAITLIDSLAKVYSIDITRLYITGGSYGGVGTLGIIASYPDKFAAAVPGASNAKGPTGTVDFIDGGLLAKTAFWAFHGDADPVVNIASIRKMVASAEEKGAKIYRFYSNRNMDNPTVMSVDSLKKVVESGANYLISEVKGGDHGAGCDEAYHCQLMFQWLFSKAKVDGKIVQYKSTDNSEAQLIGNPIPGDPVKIESGLIAGKLLPGGVKQYMAIPYAAPPIGKLRWREPQPVKPWDGVRATDQYCIPCAQRGNSNEDCLYLNIWAPANPAPGKFPVIVYIYGGAFSGGSASPSGEALAPKGVVYVNFNYRLAVLGNLSHPELTAESPKKASGNYAHLDELAVLKWVHNNIDKFGGDSGNVTLMGQSSGAIDVCYIQASPLSKELIHKVVALSGSTFVGGPWVANSQKQMEQDGLNFQQKLGARSIAEMRVMPFDQLAQAGGKEVGEPSAADGYVLPKPGPEMFAAKKQNKLPAMLCSCRDEGFGPLGNCKTVDEYIETVKRLAGDKAEDILKLYPVSSNEEIRRIGTKASKSAGVDKQMVQWAEAQVASKSPVYLSVFAYGERAGHGSDVVYWIGNVSLSGKTDGDREFSNKMADALVAFARTGNPSTSEVKWPAYTSKNKCLMNFGTKIEPVPVDKGVYYFIAHPEVKLGGMMSGSKPSK